MSQASHPDALADMQRMCDAALARDAARRRYGRTVADAAALLVEARTVSVAVPCGGRTVAYMPFAPSALRQALRRLPWRGLLPCELDPATGELRVGTARALARLARDK